MNSNPVFIIDTFNQIYIPTNKKPIIICDIDHTVVRPIKSYDDCFQEFKKQYADHIFLDGVINKLLCDSINLGRIKHTDEIGFIKMLNKVKELDGKLLFLTARRSIHHDATINHLKKVGIQNVENFEIHYTGNEITKGDYIYKYNLLNGHNHIIFIDDNASCVESVRKVYPTSQCYLFKYN